VLRRLDHVGFAAADLAAAVALFREVLGGRPGPVFEDPLQRVRVCFVEHPGGRVEIVAPLGDASPIASVLAAGGGAYHLCYEADDLDAEGERLRGAGFVPVGAPCPAVAFGGRRIWFLFHPIARLIELVEAPAPTR
jgi:methylmalonyl-CoA epimerase